MAVARRITIIGRLSSLLSTYEQASGQRLNREKTAIFFSRNTPIDDKRRILEVAGIPSSQRYDTYLGLPAIVRKSRMRAFNSIKDRVWKRLQDWKLKFLSQAGKEILLKAEENSLIARILKAKYYPNCSVLEAQVGNKPFVWKSIQSTSSLVKEGLIWRIGNGASVHIWGDKWLPTPSTYCVQSPQKILAADAVVSTLIDPDAHWWKQTLLEETFSPEKVHVIQSIPISSSNQPDTQIWRGSAKGEFSVSSAYHIAKERESLYTAESSRRVDGSDIWRRMWQLSIPNSWKIFFWRACHNLLRTRDNLVRRKEINYPSCPFCEKEVETTFHALWGVGKEKEIFIENARRLWFRRNKWIHEGVFTHPNDLVLAVGTAVDEVQQVNMTKIPKHTLRVEAQQQWKKPPEGWLKVNCDAALDVRNGRIGVGVLVRDHEGRVMAARSVTKSGFLEPTAAEALALFEGVRLCKDLGILNLIVEGGAQVVVNAIQARDPTCSRFGQLIDNTRSLLRDFPRWQIIYVSRNANNGAHKLTKEATRLIMDRTWNYSISDCICDLVSTKFSAHVV
ncbi:uncharacterized protein LOC132189464 [Corylus avellana]|uniref:uncharacterized protein LOC132189464 n=1 Tax=Corylus avellana TaxID=13451 RepID=UPI00286BBB38|nr:uncharacterized protein LOC132189464 [Corylus avellana]